MLESKACKIFQTFSNVFYSTNVSIIEKLILLDQMMPGIEKLVRDEAINEIKNNKYDTVDIETTLESILKAQLSGYINDGLENVCKNGNQIGLGNDDSIPNSKNIERMTEELDSIKTLNELGQFKRKWDEKYPIMTKDYFEELYKIAGQNERTPSLQESIYAMENVLEKYSEINYNSPRSKLGRQLTKGKTIFKGKTLNRSKSTRSLQPLTRLASKYDKRDYTSESDISTNIQRKIPLSDADYTSASEYMKIGNESSKAEFEQSLKDLDEMFKKK